MTTLMEAAQAYEPPQTRTIADMEKVAIDMKVLNGEGETKEGKKFKFLYFVHKGEDYRVAGTVLEQVKSLKERMPNVEYISVLKTGEGKSTRYQVIPWTPGDGQSKIED